MEIDRKQQFLTSAAQQERPHVLMLRVPKNLEHMWQLPTRAHIQLLHFDFTKPESAMIHPAASPIDTYVEHEPFVNLCRFVQQFAFKTQDLPKNPYIQDVHEAFDTRRDMNLLQAIFRNYSPNMTESLSKLQYKDDKGMDRLFVGLDETDFPGRAWINAAGSLALRLHDQLAAVPMTERSTDLWKNANNLLERLDFVAPILQPPGYRVDLGDGFIIS